MLNQVGDFIYSLRERKQLRGFRAMVRAGIEKCEPRYRPITDLDTTWPPGSVEYAHIARYEFAVQRVSGRVLNAAAGCGYGNAILSRRAFPVGVDLYDEPLRLARDHFPVGEYHQGNVLELPFDEESFDAVVSFETIEHVSDPNLACRQFRRVLRSGGTLVASIPIMLFHNPGTNFTWEAARTFVDGNFPGAELFLQDNQSIEALTDRRWRRVRHEKDKFLIWTWSK